MKKTITVCGLMVEPGTKGHGTLGILGALPDGTSVEIPFTVCNGAYDGPWLHVQVAQHGVEIQALEAIRRVVSEVNLNEMKGVLVYCLPNPVAFRQRETTMTYDPVPGGMNRVWPGRPDGSLTERMTNTIWMNLIRDNAQYLIDFHTGRRNAPVWVFYEAHGVSTGVAKEVAEKSERMAKAFGAELLYLETEAYGGGKTCRGAAVDHGIPGIVPEIGGESHFNPEHIGVAHRGLRNVMVDIGMIPGRVELPHKQTILKWLQDENAISVRAPKGGVFVPKVKISERIKKGDTLGIIYSPRTFELLSEVTSPRDGLVFSITENPIVVAGQPLVRVPEIIREIEN